MMERILNNELETCFCFFRVSVSVLDDCKSSKAGGNRRGVHIYYLPATTFLVSFYEEANTIILVLFLSLSILQIVF